MILNMKLPKELREEFLSLFDKEVDVYWNPFMGWLWGNCDEKLFEDYPALAQEQHDIIAKIVNHEAQVFDDFAKWGELENERRQHNPFIKDFEHVPPWMKDDVIE